MASRKILYLGKSLEIAYVKCIPRDPTTHTTTKESTTHKNIVFLHGWGSHKELMQQAFVGSFTDYTHYYIDLPGFGASPYGEALESTLDSRAVDRKLQDKIFTTSDYAHIVLTFLQAIGIRADVLVGHSFGGKVAMLCAQAEPDSVGEILLLSSAGIVRKKPLNVWVKIACAKVAKILHIRLPFLRANDAKTLNPTMYEIFKGVVNEDFSHIFAACMKKVSIFWGRYDRDTPLESGEKIHALIPNSRFYVFDGDHYFFIKQAARIESMYSIEARHIRVFGKVQGVGYRKFAKAKADELAVYGSAQNLTDGSVEIFACGRGGCLDKLLCALRDGPARSQVQEVQSASCALKQEWLDSCEFRILV